MSRRLSILFYLKKNKGNSGGSQSIYLRITIDGKRTEISTKRECEAGKWNTGAGRAKGTKEETRALNVFLDALQTKVLNVQQQLIIENKSLTGEIIKNKILGIEEKPQTLITVIEEHNATIEQLINKSYTKATWTKYNTTKKHLVEFLQWRYQIKDIAIKELKYQFITDFEFFLKSQKNIDVNTNGKYIKNRKKNYKRMCNERMVGQRPFFGLQSQT